MAESRPRGNDSSSFEVTATTATIPPPPASTMATSHSNKRHKTTSPNDAEKRLPIQKAVDAILNVDRDELMEHVRTLDWGAFALLLNRLSELRQAMEATMASFSDIPSIVIAANVFPFIENRNDWNNFSLVNKDINNAVMNHKGLTPPWPEGMLWDESIEGISLTSPTFSPDGKSIANGDNDGNVYLWNRTKGLVANWRNDVDGDGRCVDKVIFSPDGNLLVTVGHDSNIKIWDLVNDNRCLREWMQDDVSSIAFSPDGQVIATAGGEDQPVYLRNVSDGMTSREISPILEVVYSVVFSLDGGTLALGGMVAGRGSVELWKLDSTEDSSFILEGHWLRVRDLAYSLDGTLLASASGDKSIKLWDVSSRQCVRTLKGHTHWGAVDSISFTPDGNFVASGGYDGMIRFWSVASGKCVETIQTSGSIYNVEYSPNSRMLLTREGGEICLRVMGTDMLEELQKERGDLMKLSTEQLQQVPTENDHDIQFGSEPATKVALIDYLMEYLDRNERKELLMECSKWS
jgi:WD40 repeat protein